MKVTINKGVATGKISAPPSKSFAHRLIICAALAKGRSCIGGVAQSEDILATLDCIRALGATYRFEGDTVYIDGGIKPSDGARLFPCRESGSTMRFFIPLALVGGGSARFTGSERLIERGADVYEDVLKSAEFTKIKNEINIDGKLVGGCYGVRGNISSQYISGLLLALPLLSEPSVLKIIPPVESKNYIDITLAVMSLFGVRVDRISETEFKIEGGQSYKPADAFVEVDWSNSAFYMALNEIGGSVEVGNLNPDSLQGDKVCTRLFKELDNESPLIDISDCPDLGPILFAVAAAKHGAVFDGTRRLGIKESDRADAMAQELAKFGIKVRVDENSVTVFDGELKKPDEILNGHNDHRIVMALSILLSLTGGTIDGAQAVAKSQPDFFARLQQLGMEVSYED